MKILKNLATYVLGTFLALAPLKSRALEGIVKNSITDIGINNAIVRLYQGDTLLDSTRTNEEGYYRVSPNFIRLPENNIPSLDKFEYAYLEDVNGRRINILYPNQITRNIPSRFDLPSGAYFLQANNGAVVQFVTLDKNNITFNPILRLEERIKEINEYFKNKNKTDNTDEIYTLSVSDDSIQGQIGDYYDVSRNFNTDITGDINSLRRDVELISNYDMHDWDGDFLEYLSSTTRGLNEIWGDYPQNYPVNVDLDSINCIRYCGNNAQTVLNDIRDALDLWNERSNLNLFNYENVNRDNRKIIVDYTQNPHFTSEDIQDEDGRWRIASGVVYLRHDLLCGDYGREITKHEFGHATGWSNESDNNISIMRPSANPPYISISEDDGYIVKNFTLLRNGTWWQWYIPE